MISNDPYGIRQGSGESAVAAALNEVAFEQRTANLIGLAALCSANGRKELGEPFIAEVTDRLGMKETTT